jgi:ribonuclease HI
VTDKGKAPRTVGALDAGVLLARRSVILAKRRARKLAKPIYVNTDASWKGGVAGLAYVSESLGNRRFLVACRGPVEAEYLALLMAMHDAEAADLPGPIDFRLDSTAVVHLAVGTTPELVELRHRAMAMLARHREWRLAYVERGRNWVADRMARRTLREWHS